jgi:hypothetical protein
MALCNYLKEVLDCGLGQLDLGMQMWNAPLLQNRTGDTISHPGSPCAAMVLLPLDVPPYYLMNIFYDLLHDARRTHKLFNLAHLIAWPKS